MKNSKEKQLKDTKGITLIALVITIIVLLILAGVSLSMVLNQDGIFSRAEQATDKYGQAKARETLELCLSDAQMKKYESGLTETELDNKISEVGSLLPKEDENSKYQLVIVDGHIFEINRSVPKIVDYKGPANGVIVTAKITQNGWTDSIASATVTGTITKYGGGSVVSTTVTATNGVTIPADFPTTGGSYTIPNITTDTEITITTTDSDGKTATKTIPVKLVRDTTKPVISEHTAKAILMKITISARATDSESGLKSLTYKIEPNTIKDGKAEGTLTSGVLLEVEATAVGNYTVTFTATDNSNNTSTATEGPVRATDAISVEDAKRLVTSMESLQEYIGTKVDYKDGETWQIFYYDQAGDFGTANTLYLKKSYTENDTTLTLSEKTANTDPAVQMMRKMNPKWAASTAHSPVDQDNEKACVWLCDTSVWNSKRNSTYSSYAIGSPSVEMYMKAFNVWKTGNKDATNLVCKLDDISRKLGYLVGASGSYANLGHYTNNNTIEAGPNNVFMTVGSNYWWLASPSSGLGGLVVVVTNSPHLSYGSSSGANGVCPIVPLDL